MNILITVEKQPKGKKEKKKFTSIETANKRCPHIKEIMGKEKKKKKKAVSHSKAKINKNANTTNNVPL